jgi:hypothetical protein
VVPKIQFPWGCRHEKKKKTNIDALYGKESDPKLQASEVVRHIKNQQQRLRSDM